MNKSYSKFLNELVLRLNKIHGTSWSNKSWEVVIGFWLKKYLIIILDRCQLLKRLLIKMKILFLLIGREKNKPKLEVLTILQIIKLSKINGMRN